MKAQIILGTLIALILILLCQSLLADTLADLRQKLNALESAHGAGILTDEEYASKKSELEAQLQAAAPIDEAKLKALEAAHQAGVLSDEEYARKKAELMGQQTTPVEAGSNLTWYKDAGGGFQFQHSLGWKTQAFPQGQGQGVTLESGKAAISVMLFPGEAADQEFLESLVGQVQGQWQNYREIQRGKQKAGDRLALTVEVTGVNPQGVQSHLQIVVFTVEKTGYVFLLSVPEDEFASAKPAWKTLLDSFQVGVTSTGATIRKTGKTYRHPIGFTFWYPENWKCQETQLGLQLIPPDVESNQYGPTEGYLIISQAAQGISKPDDPRMVQYFEMQVMVYYPFLRRVGQIEPIKVNSGSGILITWEGQNPMGMQVRASVYATILKGYGVALVGLGDSKRMEARKSILQEIFSTFGLGEGEKDPRIFGSWRSENYSSSGIVSDRINTTSIRNMILRSDGSCTSGGQFLANIENRSSSGTVDTGTGAGTHGRWGTGNSKLYLIWNDGSYGEYTYYVQGTPGSRQMLLTPANGNKELWEEVW